MSDVIIADFNLLRVPLRLCDLVAKIWATKTQRRKGTRRDSLLACKLFHLYYVSTFHIKRPGSTSRRYG